jgi:hypothetical protein
LTESLDGSFALGRVRHRTFIGSHLYSYTTASSANKAEAERFNKLYEHHLRLLKLQGNIMDPNFRTSG